MARWRHVQRIQIALGVVSVIAFATFVAGGIVAMQERIWTTVVMSGVFAAAVIAGVLLVRWVGRAWYLAATSSVSALHAWEVADYYRRLYLKAIGQGEGDDPVPPWEAD
jgi:hypothetical protein